MTTAERARRVVLPVVGLVLLAIVVVALAIRYTSAPRAAAAEAACIDAAQPGPELIVTDSFLADDSLEADDDWRGVAAEIEPTMNRPAGSETSWVIGMIDDTEVVCVATFVDDELFEQPGIYRAEVFDDYR